MTTANSCLRRDCHPRFLELQPCHLQDDLLYESLTVWETLWFAAQLRLPRTMTKTAKRDRVNTVIAALGLNRCRETIIGAQIPSCYYLPVSKAVSSAP